jgi:hypothetical protein
MLLASGRLQAFAISPAITLKDWETDHLLQQGLEHSPSATFAGGCGVLGLLNTKRGRWPKTMEKRWTSAGWAPREPVTLGLESRRAMSNAALYASPEGWRHRVASGPMP